MIRELVFACSICFGDPASSSSKAVTLAVLFLMGVVLMVLGGIAGVILSWVFREIEIGGVTTSATLKDNEKAEPS